MNKKLVSILLAAMLSAEPCSMVYAEDFVENISVENDVKVTEEAEQEPEETQPEQDIADNEDSEEIADIEEPETKEEEIFFDSGEDAIKAEESGTASIGYSKNASVDDVSIISEPKKKNYDFGVYSTDIDLTGLAIEIQYSDGTKETLEFTRVNEIKKDSRGNLFYPFIDYDEDDDFPIEEGTHEITIGQVDGFDYDSVEINVTSWFDHSNIVSEPIKKDYNYGITIDDIDLTGLAVEIHYTDKTKETIKFTRIGEIIKDLRGHSYRSKIVRYVEDYDEYETVDYIDSLGSYKIIIENELDEEEDDLNEIIGSTEINVAMSSDILSLQKSGNDVFTRKVSAGEWVKFTPEKNGKYLISETVAGEDYTRPDVYDSELNQIDNNEMTDVYDLKKGYTYYMGAPYDKAATFTAELVPAIKSIQLEGQYKPVTYYTPANFENGEKNKNKYSVLPSPWLGKKLKITYENGITESVGVYKFNRFYGRNSAYIVYSGNQSVPGTGTYDVHFELGGKEAVLKNGIQVKNLSQMPTIAGKGTKEMAVTGGTVYACLKTTSATSYTIKCEPQTHPYLTVSQLKNGKLEQVLTVENGKKCTLKPNSVYYIGMSLHSYIRDIDKVKFTVTQSSQKMQISKTKITVGILSYTGSNVKPFVTVKKGNKTLRQGTDYTIAYNKASKAGTAVKVTIIGKGNYTGKIVKTVYIVPAKPVISSVTGGKKNLTVSYRKVTGASGYQIAYSTNQSSGYKYLNLNSKTYKKTITKLSSGKKYYVKVRAYKTINGKKYYGNYSAVKSVKVK